MTPGLFVLSIPIIFTMVGFLGLRAFALSKEELNVYSLFSD